MVELNISESQIHSPRGVFGLSIQDAFEAVDGLGGVREGENQVRICNGGASRLQITVQVDNEPPSRGCVAWERTLRLQAWFYRRTGGRIVVIATDESGREVDRLEANYSLQAITGPTFCV